MDRFSHMDYNRMKYADADEIHAIVERQIAFEKEKKKKETPTISEKDFLSSPLVNRKRIYGTD